MHTTPICYLAGPYTSSSEAVRTIREHALTMAAARLMDEGRVVFSPVTHGHQISYHLSTPDDHDFWMRQCLPLLHAAQELIVLPLAGWQASKGLQAELAFFTEQKRPISVIQWTDFPYYLDPIGDACGHHSNWKVIK